MSMKIKYGVAGLVLAGLLGCASESNNLPDPEAPITDVCSDTAVCVEGILVDAGVVEGVNYECGRVRAKTTFRGGFSCPVDEVARFLLSHPDTPRIVELGSIVVKRPPKIIANTVDPRIFITSRHLAGNANSRTFIERERNISGILNALSRPSSVALTNASFRLKLEEAEKLQFLSGLDASLTLADVSATDFPGKVQSSLAALVPARVFPTDAESEAALTKAVYSLAAGIYNADQPTTFVGISNGFIGESVSEKFFGKLSMPVDRRGRMFGLGVAMLGAKPVPATVPPYMPVALRVSADDSVGERFALDASGNITWPIDGVMRDLSLKLQSDEVITLVKGVVDRGAMAGTAAQYETYFEVSGIGSEDNRLGRWVMRRAGTVIMSDSFAPAPQMELRQAYRAFPTLDPDIWQGITFPLHLQAKIYDSTTENCTGVECLVAEIQFSILPDGNIVTDLNKDCGEINPATLKQSVGGFQEHPIGLVQKVEEISGIKYVFPYMLLSPEFFPGTPRNIDVGSLVPAEIVYAPSSADHLKTLSKASSDPAVWVDFLEGARNVSSNKVSGRFVTSPAVCPP